MPTIAAQMYTLREHCQTPSDLARSCEKVRSLGFTSLQGSAGAFNTMPASELKKILDDTGLRCVATHCKLPEMEDVERCAEYHHAIGCVLTALGSAPFKSGPPEQWRNFAQRFNRAAEALAKKGVRMGYHNHSHELSPFGLEEDPAGIDPRRSPMPLLVEELSPEAWFEIDTYWIAHGGGDPAAWVRACGGRIPAVHVKDMTITPGREQKMCEVGRGNLNWPEILDACREAGVEHYIIERDRGDLDPFESLKISREQLLEMGIEEDQPTPA